MHASPRASSEIPGPRRRSLSRVTDTSVSAGETVSRWADTISAPAAGVSGRLASTFPTSSLRTSEMPAARKNFASLRPRSCSPNGGAGISESSIWASRVSSSVSERKRKAEVIRGSEVVGRDGVVKASSSRRGTHESARDASYRCVTGDAYLRYEGRLTWSHEDRNECFGYGHAVWYVPHPQAQHV